MSVDQTTSVWFTSNSPVPVALPRTTHSVRLIPIIPYSNVNYQRGAIIPNQVTVGLGPSGDVCFTSFVNTDLVVDLSAIYVPPGAFNA